MDQLKEMGEFVRSASSTIEAPVVRRLKEAFSTKAADQPAQGNQGSGFQAQARPGRAARRRGTRRFQAAARRWRGAGASGCPTATTAPPLRPVPRRPPRAHPSGRPTAPRSGRSRPTVPPLPRPRRHLTRRPGRCRRSRRRRPPSRPSRGRRTVPAPRGCPVRRAPRPPRPTSAAPAGARGRAVPGPRRRVPARRVLVPASAPVVARRVVRIRAVRVPGRPGPGRRDLVPPVRERQGPVPLVRVPAPRVPAPGRVTTRSARPRPAWVRRLRRGPRARPHRAGKAVPLLRRAAPAVPVRVAAGPAGPRVLACPMAARVPAGSRVRVPAALGPAR